MWGLILQLRDLEMEKRDPRTVVAIILGGGAGTRSAVCPDRADGRASGQRPARDAAG